MTHFRPSPPCFLLPGNPNSLRFLATKMPKLNQYRPKLNYFWTWSGYISMPHFGPFLSCILLTMPWNLNFKFLFINRSKLGLHRPKSNHFWIQQHAKFRVIPSMRSTKKNARTPHQTDRKTNRRWLTLFPHTTLLAWTVKSHLMGILYSTVVTGKAYISLASIYSLKRNGLRYCNEDIYNMCEMWRCVHCAWEYDA